MNTFSNNFKNLYRLSVWPCITYDPSKANLNLEIKQYKDATFSTSGTRHFPDTCVFKMLDTENLQCYQETRSNSAIVIDEIFTNETNNPNNPGYEQNDYRRNIISDILQIKSNDAAITFSYCGNRMDALLVQLSNPADLIETVDYHVCANAYKENRKFIYFLHPEEINIINTLGEKVFKSKFIKKIKNELKYERLTKKY